MQRMLGDLGVIVCGMALWLVAFMLGAEILERVGMIDPDSGYMGIVILVSGPFVLVALACCTFFLWVKRDLQLFFASAVLIGLATAL